MKMKYLLLRMKPSLLKIKFELNLEYKKESYFVGFSACGGSLQRQISLPPQCDPARRAFYFIGDFIEISYEIKIK